MIDIKALAESHFESFLDKCIQDIELDNLVWENFADSLEYYLHCKEGYHDDVPYEICFKRLYDWDAEGFVEDPLGCVTQYLTKVQGQAWT